MSIYVFLLTYIIPFSERSFKNFMDFKMVKNVDITIFLAYLTIFLHSVFQCYLMIFFYITLYYVIFIKNDVPREEKHHF